MPVPLPILADFDPTQVIRDPGFSQWVFYAVAAFLLWDKISARIERNKARKVSVQQPLEVRASREPADKGEVEKQLAALAAQVSALNDKVADQGDGLMQALNAQANAARVEAQHRVSDLARVISEVDERLESRIDKHAADLHEKINAVDKLAVRHDEAIGAIRENVATVKASVTGVHRRLDDVVNAAAGKPPRRATGGS